MPLLLAQQSPTVGIWKITETSQDMLGMFQDKTLFDEGVHKIQSENRKREWLAVRLLIKHLTGVEVEVCYKENGAPFIEGKLFNISISHTRGFAAVILSMRLFPGIDIEYQTDRAWKLRMKYLNDKELALVNTPSCQTKLRCSTRQATLATLCWCAKETAYKALQESHIDFIEHFHIAPFVLADYGTVMLNETKTCKQEKYPIHYQITDEYIITWKE